VTALHCDNYTLWQQNSVKTIRCD